MMLPKPAAAIVEIPKMMPNVWSIYSPAMIMSKLSKMPNPTNAMNYDTKVLKIYTYFGQCYRPSVDASADTIGGVEDASASIDGKLSVIGPSLLPLEFSDNFDYLR
uniref:Uncharacterized protein n=1 Tax=Romanomermis culicivorax TaxID=13658 RepID=A0A915I9C4_ROMCU